METKITLTREQEEEIRERYKERIKEELTDEVIIETLQGYSLRRLVGVFADQLDRREDEFKNISLEGLKQKFHWDSDRAEFTQIYALYLYMKTLNLL